jgi:hypothetical protein
MEAIYWAWAISAVVLVALAAIVGFGRDNPGRGLFGILVDQRGRFSLTHLQLVIWTLIVLSLISGVFWGRLIEGVADPLSIEIPGELLGLLGIAAGSSVASITVKSAKDASAGERIPAGTTESPPRFMQIFLLEEGAYADRVVDVTKFQSFVLTIVVAAAYVALAIQAISDAGSAQEFAALPGFSGTYLTLLGISQGAYIAGKIPPQQGTPPGTTMGSR